MRLLKNKYAIIILGILFLAVVTPRIRFPDLDHGDEFSDANALNAGENFVKFGFFRCKFLPMLEPHFDKPQDLYTHYPPLPDIINGLERALFKTNSLYFFRSLSLLFAFLNLLFWYLFIKRFTNSPLISFLSAVFYLANPIFIFGADSLHESSYSDFLRSLIFFTFLVMLNSSRKKKFIFIFLWILVVIESLITFEYIIYLSLFFILFNFFSRKSEGALSRKEIFILMLAPVFGFLLHLLQNIWYFGSLSLALQDLRNIAVQRIANSRDSPIPHLNFPVWLQYAIGRNFSLVFFFNNYILFSALFFSFFLYHNLSSKSKDQIRPLFYLCLLLAACGISWYAFFPSHVVSHTFLSFLSRHLLPVSAVAFALFCYIILSFIKENNPNNLAGRILLVAIVVIIAFTGILKSDLPISKDNIAQAEDFLIFKNCLLNLKAMSKEKDAIGLNYFRYPFIRYYTHRHCQYINSRSSLEELKNLPGYFIFIPYRNPVAQELFGFLNQKYESLFQCKSVRFPATLFKLKN